MRCLKRRGMDLLVVYRGRTSGIIIQVVQEKIRMKDSNDYDIVKSASSPSPLLLPKYISSHNGVDWSIPFDTSQFMVEPPTFPVTF
jgi:hypothetical protein